mmetsp:Transcript_31588/g.84513  ORF Transcript_31588/g.84513 Transcript_31588/m.84513 type:complete len:174 (-) Transcript_31588:97-618(-)
MVLFAVSALALTLTFSSPSEHTTSRAQQQLFEEPSISLGIREHEALFHPAPVHQALHTEAKANAPEDKTAPQVVAAPVKAAQSLRAQPTLAEESHGDYVDISNPNKGRWNYQLASTATWPPHDTDDIPTGAYSKTYKGPYDPDYDWPDDTQVVRNDEWDKSGGVGCGMYGNSC